MAKQKLTLRQDAIDKIVGKLASEGAIQIGVFGSYARGEASRRSDLDLLVEFNETKSLLEMVRIERELSEVLRLKVDLLTEGALSPYLRDSILQNQVIIYGH